MVPVLLQLFNVVSVDPFLQPTLFFSQHLLVSVLPILPLDRTAF